MASMVSVLFIAEFIVALALFLAKVYNVMSLGRFYMVEELEDGTKKLSMRMPLILFILNGLLLGVGNLSLMYSLDGLMGRLFSLQSLLFILTIMMLIFEFFLYLASTVDNTTIKARNSLNEMNKRVNRGEVVFLK